MSDCTACGQTASMPFTCNGCGNQYCKKHRLPENHRCSGLSRNAGYSSRNTVSTSAVSHQVHGPVGGLFRWVISGLWALIVLPFAIGYYVFMFLLRPLPVVIFVAAIVIISLTVGTGFAPVDEAVASGAGEAEGLAATIGSSLPDLSSANETETEQEIHALINEEREERGLPALDYSERLASVAENHSQDMAERGYFLHTSPGGTSMQDRYALAGIGCAGGENIFKTSSSVGVAEEAVDSWMDSPGHRANILRPRFTVQGIGVVEYGGDTYVTQNFC